MSTKLVNGVRVKLTQAEIDQIEADRIASLPTNEELAARLLESVTTATQERLDTFAQTRAYDSMLSACTYVTSSVPRLKAEGQYCVEVRDSTWETLYAILFSVQAGTREMPEGYADIEDELPTLEWPA